MGCWHSCVWPPCSPLVGPARSPARSVWILSLISTTSSPARPLRTTSWLSSTKCEAVDQLLPGLGQTCTDFLNNNGPGIIESIVNENLNPTEVCTKLTLCP